MIETLAPNEIFVFGSNTAGRHGRGAALQAFKQFGAKQGVGEGITGQCYAYPTLNGDNGELRPRLRGELVLSRELLFKCCLDNLEKRFLLTKVGCGLAGFSEEFMQGIFRKIKPENLIYPEDWK